MISLLPKPGVTSFCYLNTQRLINLKSNSPSWNSFFLKLLRRHVGLDYSSFIGHPFFVFWWLFYFFTALSVRSFQGWCLIFLFCICVLYLSSSSAKTLVHIFLKDSSSQSPGLSSLLKYKHMSQNLYLTSSSKYPVGISPWTLQNKTTSWPSLMPQITVSFWVV